MSTKIQIITATIAALGLSLIVASGIIGSAFAANDQERYNIGHHKGALMAAQDKYHGSYNSDCQRYDNSHTHTNAYCQGYYAGYDFNWHALRTFVSSSTQTTQSQSINQKAQINCFLAICGKNIINQRASQDQNVDTNTANGGN